MVQSSLYGSRPSGLHVAIIMDGSGRWATMRGLPRAAGHREGVAAVRRVVGAAPAVGIGILTLFAFSSDNWRRPAHEVAAILQLIHDYLVTDAELWVERGIRVSGMGRRDRLPATLRTAIEAAQVMTAPGQVMHLRLAIDYSARDAIVRAARRLGQGDEPSPELFALRLGEVDQGGTPVPEVDLLIRTGEEQRLSDFLLWECAYAELWFTKRMWPDFGAADLAAAVNEFHTRERRFGRLPEVAASSFL